jgi:hypothetical protein
MWICCQGQEYINFFRTQDDAITATQLGFYKIQKNGATKLFPVAFKKTLTSTRTGTPS